MAKLKILHVVDGRFLGGAQVNILTICNNIDKDLFEVSVAATGGGAFEREAEKAGIPFYPLELPKVLRSRYLKGLLHLQRREEFDLVHTHGGVAGFYGRLLKKHMPQIKVVHTIHGIHYLNKDNMFVRGISKTIEQYLVQFTDMTICETENDFRTAIANRIAAPDNTVIITNGVNLTRFSNLKKNTALLAKLGLSTDNFVVGNISRFDVQKNQKLIIQAAYYLVKKYPEMRFVLVGDGKTMNAMKEYARDANLGQYIIFTGERTNLEDFYSIFDIFVLPSLWEGMPIVLLEAMAARKAIVCSNLPNLGEAVKNNYSALMIDPHDMDDLFQKISVLYLNDEARERIAQNAMIESTGYDETEKVKQIEGLYAEVLKK